ncbi:MAG: energy transducer TonB [Saprospiraceae bacterium]|nr:energy transducer TonB [Saprospiraceae bacterium]
MKLFFITIAIISFGLNTCGTRQAESVAIVNDPIVEAMYWLEDCDEEVVEYIEEEAAADFVVNSEEPINDKIFQAGELDRMPLFDPDCLDEDDPWECSEDKVQEYILRNVEWPYDAERNMEEGTEMIRVRMGADGEIKEIVQVESQNRFCTGCRSAAVHVIENMPRWIPGIKNGQPVAVYFVIPVRLKIVS